MCEISIILPFLNPERHSISRAVQSALTQSFENFELICVNNGSDKSIEYFLNDIASKDLRLKIVREKMTGSGAARNKGIENSQGKYIMFLDSDDYFASASALFQLHSAAIRENTDITGGKYYSVFASELREPDCPFGHYDDYFLNKIVKYADFQVPWGFWSYLYKKSFLIENNIEFPNYLRFQDVPFFVNAMNTAGKFYALSDYIYAHVQKTSIVLSPEQFVQKIKGTADVLKYSDKYGLEKLHTYIYRLFLADDINYLFDKKLPLLFSKTKPVALILKSINHKTIKETDPTLPLFNDAKELFNNREKLYTLGF